MMIVIYIAAPLVTNMTIGYMESSNRNFSMGNKSNNIVKTWELHP
jgi:hypothetical protein